MNKKYTKDFLEPIVQECNSISELLNKLKLSPTGGNYSHMYKVLKREGINISHFSGQGWRKNKNFPSKYPTQDYLNNSKKINSDTLKKRLIKEGYFEYKCYKCNQSEWMGEPIPLELHHIDNNHTNNNLSNLLLLCPNCHALTHKLDRDYHRILSKNKKPNKKQVLKPHTRKVERPPLEILEKEVLENGYCATGRKYGVSDNCIRKWIKLYKNYGQTSPN